MTFDQQPPHANRPEIHVGMRGPVVVVLWLIVLLFVPAYLMAADGNDGLAELQGESLNIVDVHWGFGNQTVFNRFNPVSILIQNNSTEEVEIDLMLQKTSLTQQILGLPLIREKTYFSPNASRWIQFYPFTTDDQELWRLSWGPEPGQQYLLPATRLGQPIVVALQNPNQVSQTLAHVKRFPEELFPTLVTATDGLIGLVADHNPKWQGAQAKTFLDWLHRGGQFHVFLNADGKAPEFEGELAVLNSPLTRLSFGMGEVFRHDRQLADVDETFATESLGILPPRNAKTDAEKKNQPKREIRTMADIVTPYGFDTDSEIFELLKKPAVNPTRWVLIYIFSALYVLAIFPSLYYFSQSTKNFRNISIVFLSVPALFSILFFAIGYRDPESGTEARSVALVRPLQNGTVDISQWDSVSVAAAGQYEIVHDGSKRLYAMGEGLGHDIYAGAIHNAPAGKINLPMYAFSSQGIIHRAVQTEKPLNVRVVEREGDSGAIQRLVLDVGPELAAQTSHAFVVYRGYRYSMQKSATHFVTNGQGKKIESYDRGLGMSEDNSLTSRYGVRKYETIALRDAASQKAFYEVICEPLIELAISRHFGKINPERMAKSEAMFLFVYKPMPEAYFSSENKFKTESGYALYMLRIDQN